MGSHLAIGSAMLIMLFLGIPGFLSFRDVTDGNLLNNYAPDDTPVIVVRFMYVVVMCFTFPFGVFVTRHCVNALLWPGTDVKECSNMRHYGLTAILFGSA